MSDQYWDVIQFKEKKDGGKRAVKLGYAKARDDGGFWLTFDSLPYGEGSIAVCAQREKTEGGARTTTPGAVRRGDDSEIPF